MNAIKFDGFDIVSDDALSRDRDFYHRTIVLKRTQNSNAIVKLWYESRNGSRNCTLEVWTSVGWKCFINKDGVNAYVADYVCPAIAQTDTSNKAFEKMFKVYKSCFVDV